MFTRDDLIDAILSRLGRPAAPSPARPSRALEGARPNNTRGRAFLSEYDIKKALTPGAQLLTIPKDAIVSPLAQEWLDFQGIAVVRKQSS